jgi:hypothetical protein
MINAMRTSSVVGPEMGPSVLHNQGGGTKGQGGAVHLSWHPGKPWAIKILRAEAAEGSIPTATTPQLMV